MPELGRIKELFWGPQRSWTYGALEPDQVPDRIRIEKRQIEEDNFYLNIFLRSMRIACGRVLAKRFYGMVTSSISLSLMSQGNPVEFNVATSLTGLRNIDRQDKIIQKNHRLLGPVPYRGGDVEVEIGLFAVESNDVVTPYISLLEELSNAAGVSLVKQALPFVKIISDGVYSLLGVGNSNNLVVGLKNTYSNPTTGLFVVIAGPADDEPRINLRDLALDEEYLLLDKKKQPFKSYPYMVFSIDTTKSRTWFGIPEVANAHSELCQAIKAHNPKEDTITEYFNNFERILLTSPDILSAHAQQIADKVNRQQVAPTLKKIQQINKK
jgi:hypothetical protein